MKKMNLMRHLTDRGRFRAWARKNPHLAWATFRWADIPPHRQQWFRTHVFPRPRRLWQLTIVAHGVTVTDARSQQPHRVEHRTR